MQRRKSPSPPWSESEAQTILEQATSSGKSLQAFARSRGIQVERLYKWHSLFNARAPTRAPSTTKDSVKFVAVPLSKSPQIVEVVLLSGIVIRWDPSIDPTALRELIATLKAS